MVGGGGHQFSEGNPGDSMGKCSKDFVKRTNLMAGKLFTSESVTSGHPDKVCDAISDAIVDACLTVDPKARVAVETCIKGTDEVGVIVLAGEVNLAQEIIDAGRVPVYAAIARKAVADLGYTDHAIGMDSTSEELCKVHVHITGQAPDISKGVDENGAGDQGMMFGYACTETEAFEELQGRYFPLAAALAQRLTRRLKDVREDGTLPWSRPDGKSQVTVEYDESGKPLSVHTVVVAIQHDSALANEMFDGDLEAELMFVKQQVRQHVVEHAIPQELLSGGYKLIVNGTNRFADPGGPRADAGLTGRKIIVDTYGGMGRHGGGAFSGKDPSKVDRSAAYASRWAAKHVVAAGLAERCEIQLAYVIGREDPVSMMVETFGTASIAEEELERRVGRVFDFTPKAIIERLDLLRPIYSSTANGGHFGRTPGFHGAFPWEVIDATIIAELLE